MKIDFMHPTKAYDDFIKQILRFKHSLLIADQ